jgi:hypothetical protein
LEGVDVSLVTENVEVEDAADETVITENDGVADRVRDMLSALREISSVID